MTGQELIDWIKENKAEKECVELFSPCCCSLGLSSKLVITTSKLVITSGEKMGAMLLI